jgi:dihydrolipoamide dehydrogenase
MAGLQVDVAVVGAGTAGLIARREVAKRGRRVVLIERGPPGTTCARVGCMPSKLLVHAADVANLVRHAAEVGVQAAGPVRVDRRAVLERVRRERDRFVAGVLEWVEDIPPRERLAGTARFVAPGVLEVEGGGRVEAPVVVLATGSSPWIPPVLASVRGLVHTTDDLFELEELPPSMAVLGAGAIGLEMAQALHRLGVRVAVFAPEREPLVVSDPALQREVREVFGHELPLHLGVEGVEVSPGGDGVLMRWRGADGAEHSDTFARVLAAAGRRRNLDALALEHAGLTLDAHGMPLYDPRTLQCGDAPVFIAGDVAGDRPMLHEAADEGHIAGANAARYPEVRAHVRRTPLAIVFCDPQIAVVGRRFAELPHDGIAVGEVSYRTQGRARVMRRAQGRVHIYADRESGTLLGAEMFGPAVEHTAHLLAWAVQQRLRASEALEMPFYHPVVEEGIRSALRVLCGRLGIQAPPERHDLDCGPGV